MDRIEKDSMGEVKVPTNALYGAQTQRAVDNFQISGTPLPLEFIKAVALIKKAAALSNHSLKYLSADECNAIASAADDVVAGLYNDQFPIDVYQTGSGTSTNMNVNEVIAHLVKNKFEIEVTANDHVNMSQSSNDVIPSAIYVSAALLVKEHLLPAMDGLEQVLITRSDELKDVAKTGRTHLMDAMPVTFGQELTGWLTLIRQDKARILQALDELSQITMGGTAVGSGINADPKFSKEICRFLTQETSVAFTPADSFFAVQSAPNAALAASSAVKGLAVSLMKISNDLRWMNSGPVSGLGEINLPALQPGSSIMPGKVNPVIPEAVAMVSAQIIGLDMAITLGVQSGNFELNVMLPMIANNLIQTMKLGANACIALSEKALKKFEVRTDKINTDLFRNPILITALNPLVGYMKAAEIAKISYQEGRSVLEVAHEKTGIELEELKNILDPLQLTKGGVVK